MVIMVISGFVWLPETVVMMLSLVISGKMSDMQ